MADLELYPNCVMRSLRHHVFLFWFAIVITSCGLISEVPAQPALEFAYTTKLADGEIGIFLHSEQGERRLTTDLKVAEAPTWSPDGRHIAFQARVNDNWDIYRMDVETGATTRLTDAISRRDMQPSWSADGTTIAFQSDRGKTQNIWLMDANGAHLREFPIKVEGPRSVAWLSGSNRVLFAASPRILEAKAAEDVLDFRFELFSSTAEGKEIKRLMKDSPPIATFAASVDGQHIAVGLQERDSDVVEIAIHVMDSTGNELRKLANPHGQNLCPSWLPDASGVIFHNIPKPAVGSRPRIIWASIDGKSAAEIPVTPTGGYFPAIRPKRRD
ncbi:MAG: hypothetical protein U0996_08605 [Planctomycetaceae bacterium]